jgi:hypothetical protein
MITKLVGGIVAVAVMTIPSGSTFVSANIPTEQVYAKSAPIATEALRPVVNTTKAEKPKRKECKNWLVRELRAVGFRGENLREAWAIVMRESGGRANAISNTGDYGMFQFNRAAWSGQDWWNTEKMLTKRYNAQIAYKISKGGKTWYPWDINGKGKHLGRYSSSGVYQKYVSWYNKYPCK